jgi:DNA helicase-2/ATP-dependent DNA helicase PcrA
VDGAVRVYIGHADEGDKPAAERRCAGNLAAQLGDPGWGHHSAPGTPGGYQLLTITHQLGAERGGFGALYKPVDALRGDGARSEAAEDPEPLRHLFRLFQCQDDDFAAMNLLREVCPDLQPIPRSAGSHVTAREALAPIRAAVDELRTAWQDTGAQPTIGGLLESVSRGRLFSLDEFEGASDAADVDVSEQLLDVEAADPNGKEAKQREAARALWGRPWSEYVEWRAYLEGNASYATHQGVKGSEFDRVMVVIDDLAAKYHQFSFEKLLGCAQLSGTDRDNQSEGKETVIDRTLRLLYVTCSRPRNSLALVIWTANPAKVRETLLRLSWFEDAEILSVPEA